jgi:GTP-binding protein of the ras superfamily involved in termination of M-phase
MSLNQFKGCAPVLNFRQAKRFARAMHASLVFCSTSASINVQKIFKIVLAKAFDLKCVIPEIEGVGEPILIYVDV